MALCCPRYRGRCPINWVLVNGEAETGVSLHYMTPRPDDGDIVGQRRIPIGSDDTALSLHRKVTTATAALLDELLPGIIDGSAPRTPQDHTRASYFGGRRPADGEINWNHSAATVRNLVRAVTRPYPGAFSHIGNRPCFFWSVREVEAESDTPGTILSIDPLVVCCGQGAIQVVAGQGNGGITQSGAQLAEELGLVEGMRFDRLANIRIRKERRQSVLILGINGFIGNHLSERLLASGRYEVHGMDLNAGSLTRLMDHPDFHFFEGDISIHREWIEYHVRKCDIVLPLVAIATPIEYVRNPLRVFELDFEENLRVVRYCAKYGKRIIFPSTSEVYGMCTDDRFDEDQSRLVLGPIRKQRWIYSCSKQLLDRVIWAYGATQSLPFTLFRPFNWIGPRLDSLESARIGSSRAITQLILNLAEGTPIKLVDGGRQMRCFTDVKDGVECLFLDHREPRQHLQRTNLQHRQPGQRSLHRSIGQHADRSIRKTSAEGSLSAPGRYPQGGEPCLLRVRLRGCSTSQAQHRKRPAGPGLDPDDSIGAVGGRNPGFLPPGSGGSR